MNNKEIQRFYHPELDGLRFVAFLLVFIHNAPYVESNPIWKALHEYGWIGVDLFFCLSAFLITKLLMLEYQQMGNINIRNFYFRRILRIWPIYFIYIAIAVLFIIQDQGWNNIILKHTAGLITFSYNFVFLFLTYKSFFVFFHLWTISYEEQFYVIIPWMLRRLITIKENLRFLFLLTILLLGSSIRALFIYYQVKHPTIYMLPFTHFEATLSGLALGVGLFDNLLTRVHVWLLFSVGILCNMVVFFLPNTYEIGWSLMLTYPLSGFGMALIIYTAIYQNCSLLSNILKNRVFVFLGKISYGLYIYHLISISLVNQIFNKLFDVTAQQHQQIYPISIFIISLFFTVVLSIVSYYWIEKSFLKLKQRFSVITSHPI